MYQISTYVPESNLETVKNAMFEAGGGRFNDYDSCAWQTLGQGQFRALQTANPAIGKQGQLSYVSEYKLEMICADEVVTEVINALKTHHIYEEVAYQVVRLEII